MSRLTQPSSWTKRVSFLAIVFSLATMALAEPPTPPKAAAVQREPWYIDDTEVYESFIAKLTVIAKDGKCAPPAQLKKEVASNRKAKVNLAKSGTARLDPEDVYEQVLPSVFLLGSVVAEKTDAGETEYNDGRLGTAWVLAADGVLVTNWHMFDEIEPGEWFGVMSAKGEVYPIREVLAVNKLADVAIFQITAKGLTPLPLASSPPRVGAWVGVLGHPGDRYFSFSQGHVSRYTAVRTEGGEREKWMAVTAEYAYGSSGSPVLDRTGAVVGMAALTENLDYPEELPVAEPMTERPAGQVPDKPAGTEAPSAPAPATGSLLQMVVKLTVPAAEIRGLIQAE